MWSYLFIKIYHRLRMADNLSFFQKLKNKAAYKVNNLVDDPEANKYIEEQKNNNIKKKEDDNNIKLKTLLTDNEKKQFQDEFSNLYSTLQTKVTDKYIKENKTQNDINKVLQDFINKVDIKINSSTTKDEIFSTLDIVKDEIRNFDPFYLGIKEEGDPNTLSISRIFKKIWIIIKLIFEFCFYPFIGLMVAMLVANEMIVYPVPIRIGFFIFTFIICMMVKGIAILIGGYYLCKAGYDYYVNNMSERSKQRIMPIIFSLLPVTTYKPTNPLLNLLLYPFTYPKSENDKNELNEIMNDYYKSLESSFPYLNKIRNQPIFTKGLERIKDKLDHLHDISKQNINSITNILPTTIQNVSIKNEKN